jgi:Dolichyl-phosphate-mannose-protein mannosyltransferase
MRTAIAVTGLLLVGALLIFPSLDDRYLWDDEAETALLAKNVLRFGVPVAWDGFNLISQECGTDYDANYLWRHTPWLPIYLTAASFALFDVSTFSARLPFALLGLLSVPSLYLLAQRIFADRRVSLVAAASLLLSVPFLLYARQCRYYSLAIFAAIWILYCYFWLPSRPRLAAAGLALSLTVLLHTSQIILFGVVAGLVLGFVVVAFDRAVLPWLIVALGATTFVNLPWLLASDLGGKSGNLLSHGSLQSFAVNLAWYVTRIELYGASAVLLVTAVVAVTLKTRARMNLRSADARTCLFLAVLALPHIVIVATLPYVFFRYLLTLLPVLALLQARIVAAIAVRSAPLAAAVLLLAVLPDRADLVGGRLSVTLAKYVDEITHHYRGPIEAIVGHLKTAARPGDRILISYGDLPLRFYTDLEVRGGQSCQSLAGWPAPEWVVVRHFFQFIRYAPGAQEDGARMLQYLRSEVTVQRYRPVDLPVADTAWENIPEPDQHLFREPTEWPRVRLYERRRP